MKPKQSPYVSKVKAGNQAKEGQEKKEGRFANYIDKREEIMELIVKPAMGISADGKYKALTRPVSKMKSNTFDG